MEEGDDPYAILGVSSIATDVEIRKAYRKLALEHHPDKQQDPESRAKAQSTFARLSAAYEILSDPVQRKNYNESQGGFDSSSGTGFKPGAVKKDDLGYRKKKFNKFHFHDPYEVFKRNFEEEFGFAYPGAKYDRVDPEALEKAKRLTKEQGRPEIGRITDGGEYGQQQGGAANNQGATSRDVPSSSAPAGNGGYSNAHQPGDHATEEKKKKKGFWNPFRRNKDKNSKDGRVEQPSTEYSSAYPSADPGSQALVVRPNDALVAKGSSEVGQYRGGAANNKGPPGSTALSNYQGANKGPTSTALTNYEAEDQDNNRPISMETRTIKVEHDDGRVETIEETTIKRPDGSTETFRRTDMPDSKSGNWKKKNEMLTNGPAAEEPRKMLTGGEEPKKMLTAGEDQPRKLLTGEPQKKMLTDESKKGGEVTVASSGGLVPYKGGK